MSMTKRQFLKENRTELDAAIHSICPDISLNDSDRWDWIQNDEGLYNWARSCGVNVS